MEGFADGVYVLLGCCFPAFFDGYQMAEVYASLLRAGILGFLGFPRE